MPGQGVGSLLQKHADRMADRQGQIRYKALDAIDEAITKFREDTRATERKRSDGEWVEVPVMRLKPTDVAVLIDWLAVLFDRPSRITEGRDLTVRSELPIDALNQIELTRGRAGPLTSPLPRTPHRVGPKAGQTDGGGRLASGRPWNG